MKNWMLNLLLIFFCVLTAQTEDLIPKHNSQLKIISSMDYKKLPLKMKMFKKIMPKERISYYSKIGTREELNIDTKFMREEINSSTIMVTNYHHKLSWHKTTIKDHPDETMFEEKPYSGESASSGNVVVGEKKKEILGYPCISFSAENDSSRITGFLAPSIRGLGEFEDYGMPLEMTMSSKTEKMVIETKAKSILIEPINKDLFFLTND
tara:strand:+ start:74 stop:700 length:627 start_codon:yes stop_codon:yes gene_type:complete